MYEIEAIANFDRDLVKDIKDRQDYINTRGVWHWKKYIIEYYWWFDSPR